MQHLAGHSLVACRIDRTAADSLLGSRDFTGVRGGQQIISGGFAQAQTRTVVVALLL
jgi:hypothetical protein